MDESTAEGVTSGAETSLAARVAARQKEALAVLHRKNEAHQDAGQRNDQHALAQAREAISQIQHMRAEVAHQADPNAPKTYDSNKGEPVLNWMAKNRQTPPNK